MSTAPAAAPAVATKELNLPSINEILRTSTKQYNMLEPTLPSHQKIYEPPQGVSTTWTPESVRTGVIALKVGMTADWDKWGVRHPLTVLRLEDVVVTDVIKSETRGYTAVQVGANIPKLKSLTKAEIGNFASKNIAPRKYLAEFRVTEDALLDVGTPITCQHFLPGQRVRISSISQGKGFQGVVKRHGFAMQFATHGNSVSHRAHGSTGNSADPGKVIKGKKMAGRMGGDRVTQDGMLVYKIDIKNNLIYVKGSVPGKPGTLVRLSDCPKHPHSMANPPPFPTYVLSDEDKEMLAKWASNAYLSPEEAFHLELLTSKESKLNVDVPSELLELAKKYEKEPPYEIVMTPPSINPFSIREDDEPEE